MKKRFPTLEPWLDAHKFAFGTWVSALVFAYDYYVNGPWFVAFAAIVGLLVLGAFTYTREGRSLAGKIIGAAGVGFGIICFLYMLVAWVFMLLFSQI